MLKLAKEGKIKHSAKYVEKATNKEIEEIYTEYKANQLHGVNKRITDDLINQFSNVKSTLELVDDDELLKDGLKSLDEG